MTATGAAAPATVTRNSPVPAADMRPSPTAAQDREHRFKSRASAAHALLGWLLAGSATMLAATGQIEFAISADITDLRRFLVPAILEIAVIFVLVGGYLRACDGDTPALLWLLAAAITGFATWTNLEHGGPRAGRIFAAATVLTFILWLLKLRDRYRAARRGSGLLDAPTATFRLIRWIVMPTLTSRAWLIAVEYSVRDADEALRRARLWRDTYTHTRHTSADGWCARRRTARRTAHLTVRATHCPPPAAPWYPATGKPPTAQPEAPTPPTTSPAAPAVTTANHAPPAATTMPDRWPPGAYTPTSDEDILMYQAWCRGIATRREPSGVDLAHAAGRATDATGTGRRAARRYRDAHTDAPVDPPPAPRPTASLRKKSHPR